MRSIMCPSTAASFFFSHRKLCSPVCGKAHLSLEQRWCLPLYSVPVNQELSWSRCAPTSVMLMRFSVIANTSKGQLHSVHWASSDLGQTQFEQMVLKCFSWGPVHFFPNSSSVYCQHGTMQTASWMLADFLTMTPFWKIRFMHNVDSCILQIAFFFFFFFPHKHV